MMPQPITNRDPVTAYALDVVNGVVVAGELVKAACRRHLNGLETGHEQGLMWSIEAARRPIQFAGHLHFAHGPVAGQPLTLSPWQEFIIGSLFGWLKADGSRRFKQAFISAGRKNAVTTTLSAIGLHVLTDGEECGKQVYHLGATDPQAELGYRHMVDTGRASAPIAGRVTFGRARTIDNPTKNAAAPITNSSRSMD